MQKILDMIKTTSAAEALEAAKDPMESGITAKYMDDLKTAVVPQVIPEIRALKLAWLRREQFRLDHPDGRSITTQADLDKAGALVGALSTASRRLGVRVISMAGEDRVKGANLAAVANDIVKATQKQAEEEAKNPEALNSVLDSIDKANAAIPRVSAAESAKLLLKKTDLVRAHGHGDVSLEFTVTPAGDVTDVQLSGTADPWLVNAAKETVAGWKYRPYTVNGKPTAMRTTTTLTF